MSICIVCGNICADGQTLTCSQPCHDILADRLVDQFGEFKKVVRTSTGVVYKVPTRDIIEKGIREQDLDRYPVWEKDNG